ncbi:hypothetical protein LJC63_03820 [Ruminococcaceae bacterium OttesenSCG-928-L11]|nr:hypothetical protein [Ruminococcaceae bacterium OttesenSCG-928-L11]
MEQKKRIPVALDKDLVKKLLDGLYNGAQGKSLKVVIDVEGNYHIVSKGLDIVVTPTTSGTGVKEISVGNDKMISVLSQKDLEDMQVITYANTVYFSLREKYSPYFHSLADSIVLFSRAYWNPSLDN